MLLTDFNLNGLITKSLACLRKGAIAMIRDDTSRCLVGKVLGLHIGNFVEQKTEAQHHFKQLLSAVYGLIAGL